MSKYPWIRRLSVVALIGTSATMAQAQASDTPSDRSWRFVGSAGYSFGGDNLVSGNYANGGSYSIRAGKGLELSAGAEVRVTPQWSARATLGWHKDSTNATNGEIKFGRYPLEIIGLYDLTPSWRLGAGLHRANSAKLSASGAAGSGSVSYDSSAGPVLVGQYLFTGQSTNRLRTGIEARYVSENFTSKASGQKFSGNHMSLGFFMMY